MSIWLSVILCALLGYLLGCINPAYLIARARGFDIRSRGSGNAGASAEIDVDIRCTKTPDEYTYAADPE